MDFDLIFIYYLLTNILRRPKNRSRISSLGDTDYIYRISTTEKVKKNLLERILIALATIFLILTFPLSIWFCVKLVQEYERIIILRLGRLLKSRPQGPGFVLTLPFVDRSFIVDLRTVSFSVPPREILTYDAVNIIVDAVVYYHVADPIAAIIQVQHFKSATEKLAQAGLRNVVGKKTLQEFTSQKEEVAINLTRILDHITDEWGLKIERVEMRDVKLPESMRRALAAEAGAIREAKAKIINAEGELQAAESLQKASSILGTNSAALQLRYLQSLTNVANTDNNHTVLFPVPPSLLRKLSE